MLLTAIDKPVDRPNAVYEVKWDGYRAVAYGQERAFFSRQGRSLTDRFPELAPVATHFAARRAVVDGEIVALVNGVPDFAAIQGRKTPVVYVAFDLLALDGIDLTGKPLRERRKLLEQLVAKDTDRMILSRTFPSAVTLYEQASALGLEGVVMKDADSTYVFGPKRTRFWLKVKTPEGRQQEKFRGETWGHKRNA
jgi:bifunctional non-homologous end joining protein LigD